MSEGTFSLQVSLSDVPGVVLSIERDACWMELTTYDRDAAACSCLTIHLPGRGHRSAEAARALGWALLEAATKIDIAMSDSEEATNGESALA